MIALRLCYLANSTMTAVTTINMCFKQGDALPSRGLIDIDFARTTIVLSEFWGFFVLGVMGGLLGILFTKINVACERLRQKYLKKLRLPNVLDVLACTVLTVLLSFILPFMLGCHDEWAEDSCDDPDRCLQFSCGPKRYSDLATFFWTLPEEAIRSLFDRKTSVEAHIPYQVLVVFCIFYFLMAAVSYGMAVPGGLFVPCIIIGASYGRLVGLTVQYVLTANTPSGSTPPLIIPGVYAVLGSASMLGGLTRMTLPITVMMIEITSDAQFLIPIMLVVLLAKVVGQ
jgi:chloride channel 7